MNIIITGAAGFIGSHLAIKLLTLNYRVVAIDNLSTGFIENLDTIKNHPGLTTVITDVKDESTWEDEANEGDIIIHLAATVGVKKVYINSHDTLTNNLETTNAVLEVARKKHCRVFFASTSEVYGQSESTSLSETDSLSVNTTDQGRSSYVISKLTNEISCLNYHQLKSVPVIIARLFNVVGENQKSEFGMVIPTFIENALAGEPMILYNDGSQRRSFCYIDDLIRAIISLISTEACWGNIFNIGNDTAITIKELAAYIHNKCNSQSAVIYTAMPPERTGKSEIYSRLPSIAKMKSFVNWAPDFFWQDAIDLMIAKKEKEILIDLPS
jgi:UDP-glucose 4-epimerase